MTPGAEQYPYLYYALPFQDYLNKSVCVSACPNWSQQNNSDRPTQLQCIPNQLVTTCEELYNGTNPTNTSLTSSQIVNSDNR